MGERDRIEGVEALSVANLGQPLQGSVWQVGREKRHYFNALDNLSNLSNLTAHGSALTRARVMATGGM